MELKFRNIALMSMGTLFGVIVAVALTAVAEDTELDSGPRVVPYNGVLEFNGQPLNGQADLQFTLTDVPGGQGANCIFSEEHDNVTAYSGRFSINIGQVAGELPDCVFDSDAIYIEIGVRDPTVNDDADPTNDAYIALAGSQRIHPVPFSYWSAEGSDFKIDGSASIEGNAQVGGNMGVNGQISFSNTFNAEQTIDENEDYKLILFRSSNPAESYGFGIQSGTIFTNSAVAHDFKIGGVDRLTLTETDAVFNTHVTIDGNIMNTGALGLGTYLYDTSGDVEIRDNVNLRGRMYNTDGDMVIDDSLNITGSGSDPSEPNDVGLTVNGGAAVNDGMVVRGGMVASSGMTVNGGLFVANSGPNHYLRLPGYNRNEERRGDCTGGTMYYATDDRRFCGCVAGRWVRLDAEGDCEN